MSLLGGTRPERSVSPNLMERISAFEALDEEARQVLPDPVVVKPRSRATRGTGARRKTKSVSADTPVKSSEEPEPSTTKTITFDSPKTADRPTPVSVDEHLGRTSSPVDRTSSPVDRTSSPVDRTSSPAGRPMSDGVIFSPSEDTGAGAIPPLVIRKSDVKMTEGPVNTAPPKPVRTDKHYREKRVSISVPTETSDSVPAVGTESLSDSSSTKRTKFSEEPGLDGRNVDYAAAFVSRTLQKNIEKYFSTNMMSSIIAPLFESLQEEIAKFYENTAKIYILVAGAFVAISLILMAVSLYLNFRTYQRVSSVNIIPLETLAS